MRVKLKRVLFRDDKKKVGTITKVVQSEDPGDGLEEMEGGSANESPEHVHEHNHEHDHGQDHGHDHGHDHDNGEDEDETIAKLRKLRIVKSYIKTVEKKRKITKAKLIESQK
jgi:ABC-type Zn2+ transport system substrate-binding protein/surface adhesin